MVLYFFAGIPVLLAAMLLLGAKLEFYIRLEACYVRFKLRLKLLYGLFLIKLDCLLAPSLEFTVNGTPLKKRKKKKKSWGKKTISPMEFAHIVIRGLKLEKLYTWGIVGIKDDAGLSVVAAGLTGGIIDTVSCVFAPKERYINIRPRTDGGIFSLNLAGILEINTVQIIRAALKRYIIKKREKKTSYDTSC